MDGTTLVLREFDRAAIAARWVPDLPSVSSREVALIEELQRRTSTKMFELGYRSIQATQWVGSLGIGDKTIDVVPKIDAVDDTQNAQARANLLHMLVRAGLVPVSPANAVAMLGTGKPLIAAFMETYVRCLAAEWRRGPIRHYEAHSDDRLYLKGRLNVTENERRNGVQRHRFYTTSDEFIENNVVSRVLKAALAVCREQSLDRQVARLAAGLWSDFDAVEEIYERSAWWRGVVVDRTLARFTEILQLAKLILGLQSPERDQAGHRCFSLMFDMNKVFEQFIVAELRIALKDTDLRVKNQLGGRSLLVRDGKPEFMLRPDIGVFRGDKLLALLDTKWKRLEPDKGHCGVGQSDMYQMYAYGKEFDADRTVLVYPRHGHLQATIATYEHPRRDGSHGSPRVVIVTTVDVSMPLSTHEGVRQLRSGLQRCACGEQAMDPRL